MTVEVRQLVVKSNVLQRSTDEKGDAQNLEESRKAILEECKRLILDTLQEMKER